MSLISPEDLRTRLGDPSIRLADVRWYLGQPGRGRAEYAEAHIPGAVFVDLDSDLAAPEGPGRHPLPAADAFAARMGELGFGTEHDIVVYDEGGGTIAARLWWMLDNLGHPSVRLLDGGIRAWRELGGPVSADAVVHPPAPTRLASAWTGTIDRAAVAERLGSITLLDGRAAERYRGEVEPIDPAAGHIPTAQSAPTSGNLGADGRFLSPAELAQRLEVLGAGGGAVVSYCGSGTTACHNILAARLAGLPDPLLYVGSFSDWSQAEMPVATGAQPGAPKPE